MKDIVLVVNTKVRSYKSDFLCVLGHFDQVDMVFAIFKDHCEGDSYKQQL